MRLFAWCKADKNRSLKVTIVVTLFLLGVIVFMLDYKSSVTSITDGIVRNDYGGGTRKEHIQFKVDERKQELEIEISERLYTAEEIQQMFRRCTAKLEKEMLGDNESVDRIEKNLNLVTRLEGEPVEIKWQLDRYDVMNVLGELQTDLEKDGILVQLQAVITYTEDRSQQALYECTVNVFPKTLTEEERIRESVVSAIRRKDQLTRTKKKIELPGKVEGKYIEYYSVLDTRGLVVSAMAVVIGVLFVALEKQKETEKEKERRQQLLLDYPEIVNKLTLLLGAGMTVKRAWKLISSDYSNRYAYDEMKITCREMDSGISEAECYERFGKRCGLQEYMRLGALLSQNLRKGTSGIGQVLKLEAIQAFEERKARARRMGEEAGTKLLVPMFIMLVVVFIIVIVPAYLSMQI